MPPHHSPTSLFFVSIISPACQPLHHTFPSFPFFHLFAVQHFLCISPSLMSFHCPSAPSPLFLSFSPARMEPLAPLSPLSLTPILWRSRSLRPEALWKVCVVHSADRVQ